MLRFYDKNLKLLKMAVECRLYRVRIVIVSGCVYCLGIGIVIEKILLFFSFCLVFFLEFKSN